jgi:hypothetical protein
MSLGVSSFSSFNGIVFMEFIRIEFCKKYPQMNMQKRKTHYSYIYYSQNRIFKKVDQMNNTIKMKIYNNKCLCWGFDHHLLDHLVYSIKLFLYRIY